MGTSHRLNPAILTNDSGIHPAPLESNPAMLTNDSGIQNLNANRLQ